VKSEACIKLALPITKYSHIFILAFFFSCLEIETITDPENPKYAEAVLKINRIIHWEVFDTLYVNIFVDDKNTHPDYQQNRNSSGK
jgi:hypothetical protein